MKISSDYPGGNITVNSINENIVHLQQEIRDTTSWWFYWNFCVENPQFEEIEFHFDDGEVVGRFGPACSDDGINWTWCPPECFISNSSFKYKFKAGENKKYFAFSLPYQLKNFELFYNKIKDDNIVKLSTLAISEQGRNIPIIKIGSSSNKNIFITCRHHSCESVASYVVEGIILSLLGQNRKITKDFTFHIIPFVDIDGVENGDQGKDRNPHDHNRDYLENPIYNVTKQLYKYTENMEVTAFIDLHCPWKWDRWNDIPHIYENKNEQIAEKFVKNLTMITKSLENTIKYDYMVFRMKAGEGYNKLENPNSKNYFENNKGALLSITIETPYFGNLDKPYSIPALLQWGGNILIALDKTILN